MLTNVYGPTGNACKLGFLQEKRIISCMHDLPWNLMEDFNILRDVNDTTSANPNFHFMVDFNQLITDLQLQDLPLNGRAYTWSNKRPQPSFSKLDWVLLPQHWANLSNHKPYLSDLPTTTSDHAPLSLRFKRIDCITTRAFRFGKHWLRLTEARDIVHASWHSIPVTSNIAKDLIRKFAKVCRALTSWAKNKYHGLKHMLHRTKHIIRLLDITEETRHLHDRQNETTH
jgi:hypothetical protein